MLIKHVSHSLHKLQHSTINSPHDEKPHSDADCLRNVFHNLANGNEPEPRKTEHRLKAELDERPGLPFEPKRIISSDRVAYAFSLFLLKSTTACPET